MYDDLMVTGERADYGGECGWKWSVCRQSSSVGCRERDRDTERERYRIQRERERDVDTWACICICICIYIVGSLRCPSNVFCFVRESQVSPKDPRNLSDPTGTFSAPRYIDFIIVFEGQIWIIWPMTPKMTSLIERKWDRWLDIGFNVHGKLIAIYEMDPGPWQGSNLSSLNMREREREQWLQSHTDQ